MGMLCAPSPCPLAVPKARRASLFSPTPTKTERDLSPQIRYIFRVRTELNPDGTVKHALYGCLWRDVDFFPGKDKVGLRFNYGLNPTATRNLEIDRRTRVHLNQR